jgi:hypothetical protein
VSEIPDDIDAIATDIVRAPLEGEEDFELYLRIARAIMDERERCMGIVRDELKRALGKPLSQVKKGR